MTPVEEAFYELLFGQGAWLGLIFFIVMLFLLSARNKWANIICIPISIFIGIMYIDNVATNSNLMWGAIIMFITPVFLIVMLAEKK